MKFPKDSPRKVLERVKLAWQNAPQQVHQGYEGLVKKVLQRFANKYPKFIVPESSVQSATENDKLRSDAGTDRHHFKNLFHEPKTPAQY